MATVPARSSGVGLDRYPPFLGVTGSGLPPPEGPMWQGVAAFQPDRLCGGTSFGELSGGKWMVLGRSSSSACWVPWTGRSSSRRALLPRSKSSPSGGFPSGTSNQEPARMQDSYLVDSASSHMLVSKIKPCMSKYKQLYRETANGSLNQLSFI
jgi:hypothetical protein